jgi:hypothetical protein
MLLAIKSSTDHDADGITFAGWEGGLAPALLIRSCANILLGA